MAAEQWRLQLVCVGSTRESIISLFPAWLFQVKPESDKYFKVTIFDSFMLKHLRLLHVPGVKFPVTPVHKGFYICSQKNSNGVQEVMSFIF